MSEYSTKVFRVVGLVKAMRSETDSKTRWDYADEVLALLGDITLHDDELDVLRGYHEKVNR